MRDPTEVPILFGAVWGVTAIVVAWILFAENSTFFLITGMLIVIGGVVGTTFVFRLRRGVSP